MKRSPSSPLCTMLRACCASGYIRMLKLMALTRPLSAASWTSSADSREVLEDAGRLVKQVRRSWATALPFLLDDNATMTKLLAGLSTVVSVVPPDIDAADSGQPNLDVAAAAERNAALRSVLARVIRELPHDTTGDAARTDIGSYLRRRVEIDPT